MHNGHIEQIINARNLLCKSGQTAGGGAWPKDTLFPETDYKFVFVQVEGKGNNVVDKKLDGLDDAQRRRVRMDKPKRDEVVVESLSQLSFVVGDARDPTSGLPKMPRLRNKKRVYILNGEDDVLLHQKYKEADPQIMARRQGALEEYMEGKAQDKKHLKADWEHCNRVVAAAEGDSLALFADRTGKKFPREDFLVVPDIALDGGASSTKVRKVMMGEGSPEEKISTLQQMGYIGASEGLVRVLQTFFKKVA